MIKTSDKKEEFDTGSVRDTQKGKGRYDLVSPIILRELALHYEHGAEHYPERNWEKGQPVSRFFSSAMRHLQRHLMGMRDEKHLRAALWNIGAIIHIEDQVKRGNLPAELIDWPPAYVDPDGTDLEAFD